MPPNIVLKIEARHDLNIHAHHYWNFVLMKCGQKLVCFINIAHGRSNLDKISDFPFQSSRISINSSRSAFVSNYIRPLIATLRNWSSVNAYRGKIILGQEQKISRNWRFMVSHPRVFRCIQCFISPRSHMYTCRSVKKVGGLHSIVGYKRLQALGG